MAWWDRTPKTKAMRKGVVGDDFHRASGRWSVIVRTLDRLNNWYYERITDKETGQLLRQVEEKLTDHGRRKKKAR